MMGKKVRLRLVAMVLAFLGVFGMFGPAAQVFAEPDNNETNNSQSEENDDENSGGGATNDNGCVKTSIIGSDGGSGTEFCPDGTEGGIVMQLLMNIVDILTVGVGVLGVIGITVVGLQYLTAGGSEEKTRTAKRRMFDIVIGLVAYALIYAILKWLLPTFGT